jgi:hypothetical protein
MRRRSSAFLGLGLLFVEHTGVAKLAGAVVVSGLVAVRTWG